MEVDHSLAKLFLIFCLIISVREQAYSAKSEARRGSTTIASSRRNRTALTMQNCVTKALEVAIDLDDEEKVALCGIFVPLSSAHCAVVVRVDTVGYVRTYTHVRYVR